MRFNPHLPGKPIDFSKRPPMPRRRRTKFPRPKWRFSNPSVAHLTWLVFGLTKSPLSSFENSFHGVSFQQRDLVLAQRGSLESNMAMQLNGEPAPKWLVDMTPQRLVMSTKGSPITHRACTCYGQKTPLLMVVGDGHEPFGRELCKDFCEGNHDHTVSIGLTNPPSPAPPRLSNLRFRRS